MKRFIGSLFQAKRRTQVFFDEPTSEISGSIATFRGWVASEEPIQSIVLEADGRVANIATTYDRPDVRAVTDVPYVVGWEHAVHIASTSPSSRSFTARLIVNGKTASTRSLTCTGGSNDAATSTLDTTSLAPWEVYHARARELPASAHVLEIGTRRAVDERPSHSQRFFPRVPRSHYVMADVRAGADVDVIADAHALPAEWTNRFDACVANSVFEHLERPWLAAREIGRVLAPGGFCHVATHQTFPLHGYPSDFFRFSKEALRVIFEDAGLEVLETGYKDRVKVLLPTSLLPMRYYDEWNNDWPSYAIVALTAEKRGP